jgi:hypothetical protein
VVTGTDGIPGMLTDPGDGASPAPGPVTQTIAVGLLRGMLEIASPSHHESAPAEWQVGRMRDLGFSASVDEVGTAIGEIVRGDGPIVMFLSHLDTRGIAVSSRALLELNDVRHRRNPQQRIEFNRRGEP